MIFKSKAAVLATAGSYSLVAPEYRAGRLQYLPLSHQDRRRRGHGLEGRRRAYPDGTDQCLMGWAPASSIPGTAAPAMPVSRISNRSTPTAKNCPGRRRDGRTAALWDLLRKTANTSEGYPDWQLRSALLRRFPRHVGCRTPGYLETDAGRGIHHQKHHRFL